MKITSAQYAQSLYEATEEKSQEEIRDIISNFIKVLNKNNQFRDVQKIISKFREIYNKENNIVEAQVITREDVSNEIRAYVRKYVSNKYKAEKVEINNITDESIKGGVIIRVGDEVTDGSVARQLEELKNKLI